MIKFTFGKLRRGNKPLPSVIKLKPDERKHKTAKLFKDCTVINLEETADGKFIVRKKNKRGEIVSEPMTFEQTNDYLLFD